MSLLFQVQNLSFRYEGQLEPLFQGVNVAFYAGDKVALLGHNGAGKTMFLNMLLGELSASEGEVTRSSRVVAVRQEDRLAHAGKVLEALLASDPELGDLHKEIVKHEQKGLPDPLHYADIVNDFSERGGYDLVTKLEAALLDYTGTLILVTHDKYLRERVTE